MTRLPASLVPSLLHPLFLLLGSCGTPPPLAPPDLASPGAEDMCLSACGAECVDTTTDPRHCGACNRACAPGQTCRMGTCQGGGPPPDLAPPPDLGMPIPPARGCWADPPPGAILAPPPPRYSGGTCPKLVAGKNAIKSMGHDRSFLLAVPRDLKPEEKLPLVFLWHWLGGSAQKFYEKGQIQAAIDTQRFLAILPEAKSDMIFRWPFDIGVSQARMEEEFRFFDDMLSCAAAQFNVNRNCVSSVGVSAGALFTAQLAAYRDRYLASAISLSGGVGSFAKPFGNPMRKIPFIVLWGGPTDACLGIISFHNASQELENALVRGGHFFLECIHNCGHAEPPFEGPPGLSKYAGLWQFVFDHPYWLRAGESPYRTGPLPAGLPPWCGIGKGSARPRTGPCPDKPGC
ncbi:MAG: hypothetical protein RMK29_10090 [Myxococcales bacterium]|nr:hypothetical protein [Myxococcota bacterium]MDW8282052.1 hypothetical protein [Myxococcales bacterium]